MRLADYVRAKEGELTKAGIETPSLDIRILVRHALKIDRAYIFSQSERVLDPSDLSVLNALVERRLRREPVARILGEREFWSLPFELNEATLEPRPDSETLIESLLGRLTEVEKAYRILDLGTGTGCLLLTLLSERKLSHGVGVDLEARALEQAHRNAVRLGLEARVQFKQGCWLEGIEDIFDVIVSNPPYIPHKDLEFLMPEVSLFDPPLALDGGEDGLNPYRVIIPEALSRLKDRGILALEVGLGQAPLVEAFMKDAGYINIRMHHDLGGVARCVMAEKSGMER